MPHTPLVGCVPTHMDGGFTPFISANTCIAPPGNVSECSTDSVYNNHVTLWTVITLHIISSSDICFLNSPTDQASSDNASSVGLLAEGFAKKGWSMTNKQNKNFNINGRRFFSTASSSNEHDTTCMYV